MDINSIKRLSMRARNSISMLMSNDTEDETSLHVPVTPTRGKENDLLDVEEFGALSNHKYHSSPITHSRSPSQGSPSKRMRFLQPLRSVSSFCALRSSPSKEPTASERTCTDAWASRTPERKIRPSLRLNFEESPKDQPMFDLTPETCYSSSSLSVHHSSPLPIPTPAKPDRIALPELSFRSELPAGTIPTTPAPLQLALDMDPNRARSPQPSPSPMSKKGGMALLPPPSPMPGTNLDFDEVVAASQMCSKNPPSYFNIPQSRKLPDANLPLYLQSIQFERSWTKPTQYGSNLTQDTHPRVDTACRSSALQAGSRRDNLAAADTPEPCTQESQVVLNSIKHLSSMVFPGPPRRRHCPKCHRQVVGSIAGKPHQPQNQDLCDCPKPSQTSHKTRAQKSSLMMCDPRDSRYTLENTGNAYDGTGYGNFMASMISLPSSVSTPAPTPTGFRSSSTEVSLSEPVSLTNASGHTENDEATRADHETLEDVILAYAMQEEDLSGVISNESYGTPLGEVAVETRADVELADRLAAYNLGA